MKKNISVSIIGILDYQGAQEIFAEMLSFAEQASAEYAIELAAAPPREFVSTITGLVPTDTARST